MVDRGKKITKGARGMATGQKGFNLQDNVLNQLRKEKITVTLYIINGVRLKGVIKGFDNFVILLKEPTLLLIYKHSVSTIVPDKEFEIKLEDQQ
jgi:host factor-I protein